MTTQTETTNVQGTSPIPALTFSQGYLYRVYVAAGIPEVFAAADPAKIDRTGRAAELWQAVTERVTGNSPRGLLLSGSQGTGKSLALWMLARAEIKKLLTHPESKGIENVPVTAKKFKHWVRDEFCPSQDGKRNWNFEARHEFLESKAIFLDDLTIDPSVEAFRPVREFLDLLVDDLINMIQPPTLSVSTNNTAEDWTKLLGSQFVDRIAGPNGGLCEIVRCHWKSYR